MADTQLDPTIPTLLETAAIKGDVDGVWEPVLPTPPEHHKATKAAKTDPIKLTVQRRAEAKAQEAFPLAWWFSTTTEGDIPPWWSQARDNELRAFWMQEGNDILSGAVSSMVKKFKAMSWEIEGPESVVKHFQETLAEADFGQGWGYFLSKLLTDYCTTDKGAFFEVIGEGKADKPLESRAVGVAHLDSLLCQLTGDPVYPVLYWNVKDGLPHKLHATRVVHLVDMPSPNESMLGIGFCAISRVIASSQILLMLSKYKREKLSDLPPAGLLTLSNIMPRQWEDQKAEYRRERRKLGQELWANIMTLFSLDPAQPATANFTPFASLPDSFDERTATDLYINIVALAFGVDVREFWPMSAGALGTASETLVMHQKAKGKGVGEIISSVERAINWAVLPKTCTFAFAFKDDDEDMASSQLLQVKTGTIMSMWSAGQDPAGGPAVVSREEVRQMLADNVSYFNESFLETDATDEQQATDTEAQESVDEDTATDTEQEEPTKPEPVTPVPDETEVEEKAYGRKVTLDAKGHKVIKNRRRNKPWIEGRVEDELLRRVLGTKGKEQPREPAGIPTGGRWTSGGPPTQTSPLHTAEDIAADFMMNAIGHVFNKSREKLLVQARQEIPQAISAAKVNPDDIVRVVLFGSFNSKKGRPNDVDLMVEVRDRTGVLPHGAKFSHGAGSYDGSSWMQGAHRAGIVFMSGQENIKQFLDQVEFEAPTEHHYGKPEEVWHAPRR